MNTQYQAPQKPNTSPASANWFRSFRRRLKVIRLSPKKVAVTILVCIVLMSQVLTFINEGEVLGIKVREVTNKSKGLSGLSKKAKDETGDSKVCRTVSTDFVSSLFDSKEFTKSTLYKDVKREDLTSNSTCIYTTDIKDTKVEDRITVSVSLQEKESTDLAKAEAQKAKQKEGSKSVGGLGDEAYFSDKSNQLTVRKGNKVVNVFIKVGSNIRVNIEDTAKKVSEKLLD